ncbi:MAG: hypothetical protein V1728_02540 [Candidatus Micrarchaeota archaeon]
MKGQLSAEMLILLALVLGLLLVAYTYMSNTVKKTGDQVNAQTARVIAESTYCEKNSKSDPCAKLIDQGVDNAKCDEDKNHCYIP